MNLPTRSFTDLVRDMSAAITASATNLVDMSIGSVLRAIIEANAAVVLWAQWLCMLALQTTRAATSTGPDLDSWMADFSLTRLAAISSVGVVTFSRFSPNNASSVPLGTVVKTQDGTVGFAVTADPNNPTWQPETSSYALSVGVASVDLPVTAQVPGSASNVQPNTVTLLASAIAGVDYVNNALAIGGGVDPETDDQFRVRFSNYFAARSRATVDAISYAITTVNPALDFVIQENVDVSGGARPGSIMIIVNDGSGSVSDELFSAISSAVNRVRPIGTTFSVQPPQIEAIEIGMSLSYSPGSQPASVQSSVYSTLEAYVNNFPIGATLSITRLSQIVYNKVPDIVNIANVTLNGAGVDLAVGTTTSFRFQGAEFS